MSVYIIRVVEPALDRVVHEEEFQGTLLEAEQRLGELWNDGPASAPGRYRATARPKGGGVVHTID